MRSQKIIGVILIFLIGFIPLGARSLEMSAKSQVATIIYAGLGGAVLGLSTLSFTDKPEEHLSNIVLGMALGVIGGTIYVTSQVTQATPTGELTRPAMIHWVYRF